MFPVKENTLKMKVINTPLEKLENRARGVVQAVERLPSKFKPQDHEKKKKLRK
jgi:hypothetical protein